VGEENKASLPLGVDKAKAQISVVLYVYKGDPDVPSPCPNVSQWWAKSVIGSVSVIPKKTCESNLQFIVLNLCNLQFIVLNLCFLSCIPATQTSHHLIEIKLLISYKALQYSKTNLVITVSLYICVYSLNRNVISLPTKMFKI